jgi:hypothetical protein
MITLQQSKKLSVEYGRLKAEKFEESCDIDEERNHLKKFRHVPREVPPLPPWPWMNMDRILQESFPSDNGVADFDAH